jgi:hypothetical protein
MRGLCGVNISERVPCGGRAGMREGVSRGGGWL